MKLSTPIFLLGIALLSGGCQTTTPTGSSHLASVLVQTRDVPRIEAALRAVLTASDYRERALGDNRFVFERPGSGLNQAAHGGWLDEWVWERVKGNLRKRDDQTTLIEMNAYMVRNRGDEVFEEEQRLWKVRAGPYQVLLNEVKTRVESADPVAAGD